MGRWDDIMPESEPEVMVRETVEGNFYCMVCDESVDKAIYLRADQILTWKCSTGHVSHIEVDL